MFKVIIEGEPIPDETCYIIGKSGIFLKKKFAIIESITKVDEISFLNDVQQSVSMNIAKIPFKSFKQILAFFKWAWDTYHSEAMVILHYNPGSHHYKIEVPNQIVSGGSIDYTTDVVYENYLRIGTIHSHGAMAAFHSGTDVHDEIDWDGLHITVGNITKPVNYSLKASLVSNGFRRVVEAEEYVYRVENNFKHSFPKSWKKFVKKAPPIVIKFQEHQNQQIKISPFGYQFKTMIPFEPEGKRKNPCVDCVNYRFRNIGGVDLEEDDDFLDDDDDDDFFGRFL